MDEAFRRVLAVPANAFASAYHLPRKPHAVANSE